MSRAAHRIWTWGVPVVTVAALGVSHQAFAGPSVGALVVGLVGMAVYGPGLLVIGFRSGKLVGVRGKVALASVSAFLALFGLVLTLACLRGEFFRDPADRKANLAPHPTLGHAPTMMAWAEEAGLTLAETIGQNLETVDPEREQVVVIGDSVLYGWGVEAGESAVRLLAGMVQDLQVMNFSVSGYSLTQYYLYLEEHLHKTRPKIVVVGIFAGNDYESTGTSNWHGHATVMFVPAGDDLALWRAYTPRFNCIDFLSSSVLFSSFLWHWPDFSSGLLDVVCNAHQLAEPEHEEVVRRILRNLEGLVHAQGAELLYVLLPDSNDFYPDREYVRELSKYRDLERLLREGGYDVLWFFDDIAATGVDAESLYFPGDSAHYNAEGNRLLAESLRQRLARDYGIR